MLARAVLQTGRPGLQAELHGNVALMFSERTVVVRGREAPGVVTKEVGKRRRRSPDDAALNDSIESCIQTTRFRICPGSEQRVLEAHFFLSSSFEFLLSSDWRQAARNVYWSTGRQPLGLVLI